MWGFYLIVSRFFEIHILKNSYEINWVDSEEFKWFQASNPQKDLVENWKNQIGVIFNREKVPLNLMQMAEFVMEKSAA